MSLRPARRLLVVVRTYVVSGGTPARGSALGAGSRAWGEGDGTPCGDEAARTGVGELDDMAERVGSTTRFARRKVKNAMRQESCS